MVNDYNNGVLLFEQLSESTGKIHEDCGEILCTLQNTHVYNANDRLERITYFTDRIQKELVTLGSFITAFNRMCDEK